MPNVMPHTVSVKFQPGWGEWRPECTCGWVGSYCTTRARADREASEHREAEA